MQQTATSDLVYLSEGESQGVPGFRPGPTRKKERKAQSVFRNLKGGGGTVALDILLGFRPGLTRKEERKARSVFRNLKGRAALLLWTSFLVSSSSSCRGGGSVVIPCIEPPCQAPPATNIPTTTVTYNGITTDNSGRSSSSYDNLGEGGGSNNRGQRLVRRTLNRKP